MKKTLISASLATLLASAAANAETVGIAFATFDDNFHTVMRTKIQERADSLEGVDVQFEDAQNDVGKQLDQVNNFIASGRRRDHRDPRRHLGSARDDGCGRSGRSSACLRQPPADQRGHPPRQ